MARAVCLSSRKVELPDGGDPIPRQQCQGKIFSHRGGVVHIDLPPPRSGITVYLKARGTQAVKTMPIDITFPGQKLIDREIVEREYLLDRNPAAAHCLDNGRLASHRPPLPQRRQLKHLAQYIVQAGGIRRTFVRRRWEIDYRRCLHVIALSLYPDAKGSDNREKSRCYL
jgi:hypothetical protein